MEEDLFFMVGHRLWEPQGILVLGMVIRTSLEHQPFCQVHFFFFGSPFFPLKGNKEEKTISMPGAFIMLVRETPMSML
jgi:hypothetical protein